MIIKDRDGVFADIERLSALAAHPNATTRHRIEIEEEIRRLKAGERGESSAANHMKTFFGASKNWAVLNDLRLEHEGVVAQIDHLLIGRLLDIWICESKHVASGVKINEFGEFMTFYNRTPRAMASPIEQVERHMHVLGRVLDSAAITLPTRLGMTLRPRLRGLVLISHGTIQRPKTPVPGLEMVIKSEHLKRHVTNTDDGGNPFDLAKIVRSETINNLGEQLASMHRPIAFDWERRLGLRADNQAKAAAPIDRPVEQPSEPPAIVPRDEPEVVRAALKAENRPAPAAAACASCGATVSRGVRAFCVKEAERFNGAIYCMPCQAQLPP